MYLKAITPRYNVASTCTNKLVPSKGLIVIANKLYLRECNIEADNCCRQAEYGPRERFVQSFFPAVFNLIKESYCIHVFDCHVNIHFSLCCGKTRREENYCLSEHFWCMLEKDTKMGKKGELVV